MHVRFVAFVLTVATLTLSLVQLSVTRFFSLKSTNFFKKKSSLFLKIAKIGHFSDEKSRIFGIFRVIYSVKSGDCENKPVLRVLRVLRN